VTGRQGGGRVVLVPQEIDACSGRTRARRSRRRGSRWLPARPRNCPRSALKPARREETPRRRLRGWRAATGGGGGGEETALAAEETSSPSSRGGRFDLRRASEEVVRVVTEFD
jgi:hypothetical protein